MKLSEILTVATFIELTHQAEANSIATFEDSFWKSAYPAILGGITKDERMLATIRVIVDTAFKTGALIGAQQGIMLLMNTIKDAELDK